MTTNSKKTKKCPHCQESFRSYNINHHQKSCPYNPKNKKYCKECGILLTSQWQTEFCSNSCAAKYNNRNRDNSFHNQTKVQPCAECGETIEVNIHAGLDTCCRKCKQRKKEEKQRCPYCGRLKCRRTNKVCQWLSKGGISTFKKIGGNESIVGTAKIFDHVEHLIETLYDEYQNGESLVTLSEKYNINHQTVKNIFLTFDYTTKSQSEANINARKEGRIDQMPSNTDYKSGHHKTWYGKQVFLRSSYEFDYAKQLDEQEIYYEVEPFHIPYEWQGQEHIYVPDFYIPSQNLIVEVKNQYFYENDKERIDKKLNACEQCGYYTKLIIPNKKSK